jgi:cation diffusion facilitator family transporter
MEKRSAAIIAVVGGLAIFMIKIVAYLLSDSVALLSDALESIINIAASMLMFYSVYISGKPADENHEYGHQKVENISSLVEGFLILVAAIFIIHTAIERIFKPVILEEIDLALIVSLAATTLNGLLSAFLGRTASEKGSMALEGDSKHLMSDVITSLGVAGGLWIGKEIGWRYMDPLMALLVSVLIVRMGLRLLFRSAQGLMDDSVPKAEAKIRAVLERHSSRYVDFHDLKTRQSGNQVFAELHLSVDAAMTVDEAHAFTDHLETDLKNELPEVSITIHVEPTKKTEVAQRSEV